MKYLSLFKEYIKIAKITNQPWRHFVKKVNGSWYGCDSPFSFSEEGTFALLRHILPNNVVHFEASVPSFSEVHGPIVTCFKPKHSYAVELLNNDLLFLTGVECRNYINNLLNRKPLKSCSENIEVMEAYALIAETDPEPWLRVKIENSVVILCDHPIWSNERKYQIIDINNSYMISGTKINGTPVTLDSIMSDNLSEKTYYIENIYDVNNPHTLGHKDYVVDHIRQMVKLGVVHETAEQAIKACKARYNLR